MAISKNHVSTSLPLGLILALSGGFMDSYSYVYRDKVFANAQTGNLILLGIHFSKGNFKLSLRYLLPVLAFATGIAVAEYLKGKKLKLSWQQTCLLIEAIILLFVGYIPLSENLLANALTSLACGIQVESYRSILGYNIATTMCIGNLRSGTRKLVLYFTLGLDKYLKEALLYYLVIAFFIFGAVTGYFFVTFLGAKAILTCSILLLVSFFHIFFSK